VQTKNEITRDQDRDNQAEEEVEEEQAEGGTDQEEAQSGTAGEEIEEVVGKDKERRAYSCRPGPTLNVFSQRIKDGRALPEGTPVPHNLRMLAAEEEQIRP
jgi:hypothetical protein